MSQGWAWADDRADRETRLFSHGGWGGLRRRGPLGLVLPSGEQDWRPPGPFPMMKSGWGGLEVGGFFEKLEHIESLTEWSLLPLLAPTPRHELFCPNPQLLPKELFLPQGPGLGASRCPTIPCGVCYPEHGLSTQAPGLGPGLARVPIRVPPGEQGGRYPPSPGASPTRY